MRCWRERTDGDDEERCSIEVRPEVRPVGRERSNVSHGKRGNYDGDSEVAASFGEVGW